MARLSAHGAEVARLERRSTLQDSGTSYRETVALMEDGVVLRKVDFYGQYPHGTGWKKYARIKDILAPERWVEFYVTKKGYIRVNGK